MLSKILKNSTWLVGGKVISDGLSFLFYIYLARAFGEEGLGNYSFAFATATLFGIGVEFGLRALITRDVAKNLPDIKKYRGNILIFQVFLFVVLGMLLYLSGFIFDYSRHITVLLTYAYLGISFRAMGMSFIAFLEAADKMGKSSILEIVSKFVIVLFGSLFIFFGLDLQSVMFVHVISGLVYLSLNIYFVKKLYGPIKFEIDLLFIKKLATAALPFIGASVLYILYSRVDYMMIYYFVDEAATGAYSAAFRIIETSLLITSMVGLAIYPSLARSDANHVKDRDELFIMTLKWIAIFSMLGFLILLIVGNNLILFLFGDKFSTSGELIQWMSVLIFIGGIKVPYWRFLFAINKEATQLRIQGLSVLINLILNLILIPRYGIVGAIAGSIVSEVYLLIEFHRICSKIIQINFLKKSILFLLISGIIAALGLIAKLYFFWIYVLIISVLLFGILIYAFGIINKKEKDKFLTIIRKFKSKEKNL